MREEVQEVDGLAGSEVRGEVIANIASASSRLYIIHANLSCLRHDMLGTPYDNRQWSHKNLLVYAHVAQQQDVAG